jgi:DNA-binding NtrC family response regulator
VRDRLEQLVEEMLQKGIRFDEARRELERRFIIAGLAHANGNLGRTADRLGIHRNTLARKIQEYRIKPGAGTGGRGSA